MTHPRLLLPLGLSLLLACSRQDTHEAPPSPAGSALESPGSPAARASSLPMPTTSATASAAASASAPAPEGKAAAIDDRAFGALVTGISEEGGKFPSDNYVSNETSFLHVTRGLASHRGGGYIGVGPEQNFTYLSILEPEIAFLVDIRRDNMVMHLLYKVLFERSATRAEFLAALTSRAAPAVAVDAPIEKICDAVEQSRHDPALEGTTRKAVIDRAAALGVALTADDKKHLREALAAFGKQGLGIHYTMEGSARKYPSLREILGMVDDDRKLGSFASTDAAYQKVRRMQIANRVVPVVGDLAGDGAVPRIADELKKRQVKLEVFYVSNVEQYLFSGAPWARWIRNVKAMPWAEGGALLRVYFDQGKAHPSQRPGHRTTSMVVPAASFLDRAAKKGWKSWWEVATEP